MTYVFDTSPLSALFKNFYRDQFPSLWERFDELIADGDIISTREVLREIEDGPVPALREWSAQNREVFTTPTADEGRFVARIYGVAHFQQNIEQQKLLNGGNNADPFVISKAATIECPVVTLEVPKPNSVKIPNICDHFDIPCLSLQEFMATEDWRF